METDILYRSSSFLQHSVQLALGGSKNLKVVDIQEIGNFDFYGLGEPVSLRCPQAPRYCVSHSVNNLARI